MYIMPNGNRLHKHTTIAKLLLAVIAVFVFVLYIQPPLLTMADTDTFITNLRLGDRGESVMRLQIALNADPQTRVASSGSGSPGLETTYFGLLTKAAVVKFQNVYYTEVLAPVGLTNGTGFFGPSSRAKMNALTNTTAQSTTADTPSTATEYTLTTNIIFNINLTVGDNSQEVKKLQKVLNTDSRTRIANSGLGSLGLETTYFGTLTANAVARFQELYASEILTPVGLSRGSGYFGPSTRAKMNALSKTGVQSTTEDITTLNYGSITENFDSGESLDLSGLTGVNSDEILDTLTVGGTEPDVLTSIPVYETSNDFSVGRASSYAGSPGEAITIDGIKLTNGTKINFGDTHSVTGTATLDGESLTFKVPDITKGPYFLTFTSGSGEEALRIMDFVITVENATAPEIFSISPAIGPNGSQITIYGSGFTLTNNQVEFGQNIVTGIPSPDGKSIVVNVTPNIGLPDASAIPGLDYAEWPVFIYIANANGRTERPSVFVIKN